MLELLIVGGQKRPAASTLNTIYIDPTNNGSNRNGSKSKPYNSFTEVGALQSGKIYKIKAGTEMNVSSIINLSNLTGTIISMYGLGARPKIKFTSSAFCAIRMGNSTNCKLSWIELFTDLSVSLVTLIARSTNSSFDGGTGNIIEYCSIHDVKQGTAVGGMGIRGGGVNTKIQYCEIYNCGEDGIYEYSSQNLEIAHNHIHHVNQNYAGASIGFNSQGNSAGGDGIQLGGNYVNFHIHHNIVDRSDIYTGNKYAIILNQLESQGFYNAGGIIEYNDIIVRNSVLGGIIIGLTKDTTVRYNRFYSTNGCGSEGLFKLAGYRCVNVTVHNNIFYDANKAIRLGYIYSGNTDYADVGGSINTKIFNNTMYNMTDYCIYNDGNLNVQVKNNIFKNSPLAYSIWQSPTWDISNNCYHDIVSYGTPGAGLNPILGDPMFIDINNKDFHITEDSSCRNMGIDLSITSDIDGVTIPQESNPTIGAYEYVIEN